MRGKGGEGEETEATEPPAVLLLLVRAWRA